MRQCLPEFDEDLERFKLEGHRLFPHFLALDYLLRHQREQLLMIQRLDHLLEDVGLVEAPAHAALPEQLSVEPSLPLARLLPRQLLKALSNARCPDLLILVLCAVDTFRWSPKFSTLGRGEQL